VLSADSLPETLTRKSHPVLEELKLILLLPNLLLVSSSYWHNRLSFPPIENNKVYFIHIIILIEKNLQIYKIYRLYFKMCIADITILTVFSSSVGTGS
jgi:hypothetical protein